MEPDDAYRWPEALQAKRGLGDYPTEPAARSSMPFRTLWQLVLEEPRLFSAERRSAGIDALLRQPLAAIRAEVGDSGSTDLLQAPHESSQRLAEPAEGLVIKTVNVALCADVIAQWLGAGVIVVSRDPRKVISSWLLMEGFEPEALHLSPWVRDRVLEGIRTPELKTRLEKIAWTVATLDLALKANARKRDWIMVTHEELIADPHGKVRELVAACGLSFDQRVDAYIDSRRMPGSGFETMRSQEQHSGWKGRLTKAEWAQVDSVLSGIPSA